jgi:hypothetical protein
MANTPLTPEQALDPVAVTTEIAVAQVAQTSGVRVHHAEHGQPPVTLSDDPAGERLSIAIKADVGDTRLALGAGW